MVFLLTFSPFFLIDGSSGFGFRIWGFRMGLSASGLRHPGFFGVRAIKIRNEK